MSLDDRNLPSSVVEELIPERPQRRPVSIRAEDLRVEHDPTAGIAQPVAQLIVLVALHELIEREAQPGLAARSELRARAGKDARAALHPGGDLLGGQAGSGEIDPREIGGVEAHGAGAGRCGLDAHIEHVAVAGEIGQQRVEPGVAGAPGRLGRGHAEEVIGAQPARHDARVETTLQRGVRGEARADVGAGQVECLGGGDAGDQAVGDLGRGGDGRRVLGAGEDEVAMDLVGHQRQIVLGAKAGQRTNLVGRPHGAAGIVRAAEENDLGPRRQLLAQGGEVHGVAAVGLDQLRIEDAPLVGQDDAAEGVIGGREDDDLVAGGGGRLQDEAEPRHDAGRRADPVGIHAQAMPAGHPIRERGRPAAGVGVVAVGGAL